MEDASANNDTAYKQFYDRAQLATGLVFYPFFCVLGLVGHSISIHVLRQKRFRSSTTTYLITMALSDITKLVGDVAYVLVTFLLIVYEPYGNTAYAYLYPYAHYFLKMTACLTSWLIVCVALERYIMVCLPTRARFICTEFRAMVTTIFLTSLVIIVTLPYAFRYRTVAINTIVQSTNGTYINVTSVGVDLHELWKVKEFFLCYGWLIHVSFHTIPLLLLCFLNAFIIRALWRTREHSRKFPARRRITIMLVTVTLVFMVCVTPDAVMSTILGLGYTDSDYLVRGIREITDLLVTANSAVDFLLYCSFHEAFRQHFTRVLNCCSYRNNPNKATSEAAKISPRYFSNRPSPVFSQRNEPCDSGCVAPSRIAYEMKNYSSVCINQSVPRITEQDFNESAVSQQISCNNLVAYFSCCPGSVAPYNEHVISKRSHTLRDNEFCDVIVLQGVVNSSKKSTLL